MMAMGVSFSLIVEIGLNSVLYGDGETLLLGYRGKSVQVARIIEIADIEPDDGHCVEIGLSFDVAMRMQAERSIDTKGGNKLAGKILSLLLCVFISEFEQELGYGVVIVYSGDLIWVGDVMSIDGDATDGGIIAGIGVERDEQISLEASCYGDAFGRC